MAEKDKFYRKIVDLKKAIAKLDAKPADKSLQKAHANKLKDAQESGKKAIAKNEITAAEFVAAFATGPSRASAGSSGGGSSSQKFRPSVASVPAAGATEPVVEQAALITEEGDSGYSWSALAAAAAGIIATGFGVKAYLG